MKKQINVRKSILSYQIFRLAKIYTSKPVSTQNISFHNRVAKMQCELIREKQTIK